jgi:hypothetical protein
MRMFFALLTTICRPHLPCSEVDGVLIAAALLSSLLQKVSA